MKDFFKKLSFQHILIGFIVLAILTWGIAWGVLGENPYNALGMEHWFIQVFLWSFGAVIAFAVATFIGIPIVQKIRRK